MKYAPTRSGPAATTYVQDWQAPLSRILEHTTNGTTSGFVYSPAGERLLTTRSSGDSFALTDHLGTPRLTLGTDGSVQSSSNYTLWGETEGTPSPNPFGFTGELHDVDTGLVYLRARWYNPETGTFLGRDPFDGRIQQPASLQAYHYTWNAPTMHTDPSGRDPWWDDHEDIVFDVCETLLERDLYHEHKACLLSQEEYRQQRREWNYYGKPTPPSDPILTTWREKGCFYGGFVPAVGEIIDAYEIITFNDCGTGESLSFAEWAITVGCVFIPFVGGRLFRGYNAPDTGGGRGGGSSGKSGSTGASPGGNRHIGPGAIKSQYRKAITGAIWNDLGGHHRKHKIEFSPIPSETDYNKMARLNIDDPDVDYPQSIEFEFLNDQGNERVGFWNPETLELTITDPENFKINSYFKADETYVRNTKHFGGTNLPTILDEIMYGK